MLLNGLQASKLQPRICHLLMEQNSRNPSLLRHKGNPLKQLEEVPDSSIKAEFRDLVVMLKECGGVHQGTLRLLRRFLR